MFGCLLRSGLHDEFVTVVPLQITQRCQSCHKLLTTQRQRLLTDLEKKSISNAKEDIGKFLSSNKDILDKPFLVYWICVDDIHWISIIGINLSHCDKKRVCGFNVLDSLQDAREGTSYLRTLDFVSFSTIYARRMSTMTALSCMGNLIV